MSEVQESEGPGENGAKPVTKPASEGRQFSAISPDAAIWFGAGLIGLALICLVVVNVVSPLNSLGSAALGGTAILATGLVALIVLSRAVGVIEPGSALGLPPGSIRALLALGLAIVFVSTASWTLGGLFDPLGRQIAQSRMDKTKIEDFRKQYAGNEYVIGQSDVTKSDGAAPTEAIVTVYMKRTVDAGLQDMAKQILTISATVLVTVVGFYFGSNSAAEATRTLQSIMGGAGAGPATPDAVLGVAGEIASTNTDVGKKMAALGADPMKQLADAVKGASTDAQDKMSRPLVEAQQLFDSLKAAQADVIAKSDRAKEVAATVKPDVQGVALLQSRDQLVGLRTEVAEASRKFEQNLAAFTAVRDTILRGTGKG